MSYAEYGLDETKKSQDHGTVGRSYCPWCQDHSITNGFSMCFSNFCICNECVQRAKDKSKRWKPDDGYGCFKCSKQNKGKVYGEMYFDKAGSLSICKECLEWADQTLNKKTNPEMSNNENEIVKESPVETRTEHLLRKYKGYELYDTGPYLETGQIKVDIRIGESIEHSVYYNPTDASDINKVIERAKEWINETLKSKSDSVHHYSDKDLAMFRELIEKKLEGAKKEFEYLQGRIKKSEDPDKQPGEEVLCDAEIEQLSGMAERQLTFIDHLNAALERIANKTYGICRDTGKLIDKARLLAVPHATLSIEAKSASVKSSGGIKTETKPKAEPVASDNTADNKTIQSNSNTTTMSFFKQLSATGEVDVTLRMMKKGDEITIHLMPGSKVSKSKPIILTGTADELDEEFFSKIMPEVAEIRKGIKSNIDEVKQEAKTKPDTPAKKSPVKKKSSAPAKKAAPVKKAKPAPVKKDKPKTNAPKAEKEKPVIPEEPKEPSNEGTLFG